MALGPVPPKEFLERVDFLVRNDDGSAPDPPATRLLQETRLPDGIGLLPNPFPGLVPIDLSEQPSAPPGAQLIRPIAHEAEGLEVEFRQGDDRETPQEDSSLADDGLEELLVEGFTLFRAVEDHAKLHVELAVEGEEDLPCGILGVPFAVDEQVDIAPLRRAASCRRTKQDHGSHAGDGGDIPCRGSDRILEPGRVHPSTSSQMDTIASKLLRALSRSARVPELPYTNLTRALWSRYRNASTTTEVFGPRMEGFCLSSSGTRWCF